MGAPKRAAPQDRGLRGGLDPALTDTFWNPRCLFYFFFRTRSCKWGMWGQQLLKLEPPHITVRHHLHHFAWAKSSKRF